MTREIGCRSACLVTCRVRHHSGQTQDGSEPRGLNPRDDGLGWLGRPLPAFGVPFELFGDRLDDEGHDRRVGLHAMHPDLPVEILRNARCELDHCLVVGHVVLISERSALAVG